jgi:hypothetical protein
MVFTHNVGKMFAAIMRPPAQAVSDSFDFIGIDGQATAFRTITNSSTYIWNGGIFIQVGKGTTPATPADVNIETPFSNTPESVIKSMSSAGYIAGTTEVIQNANINNVQENDSITEVCTYVQGTNNASQTITLMITRNIISPAIPFLINENINLETKVTF